MFRGRRGPKPVQKKIKPRRMPGADFSVVVHQLPAERDAVQEALAEVFDIDPGLAKDALRQIPVALGDRLTVEEAKAVCKALEKVKASVRVWNGQSAKQQYRFMDFRLPLKDEGFDVEQPS